MQPAAAAQILRKDRAEIDPALHSLPGKCGKFAWGIRGVHNKPEGGCITAAAAAAHSLGWAASDKTPGSAAGSGAANSPPMQPAISVAAAAGRRPWAESALQLSPAKRPRLQP